MTLYVAFIFLMDRAKVKIPNTNNRSIIHVFTFFNVISGPFLVVAGLYAVIKLDKFHRLAGAIMLVIGLCVSYMLYDGLQSM